MKTDDLKYSNFSSKHLKYYENRASDFSGRFLRWFLEHILRLDEFEADDASVDAKHDKGVDAIYVDDVSEVVYIVQAKTKTSDKATLGDTDLKEFSGTLKQFSTAKKIEELVEETKNERLKQSLVRNSVSKCVDVGYDVKGIFITNVLANEDAYSFVKKAENIDLYDSKRIAGEYVDLIVDGGISGSYWFDVSDSDVIEYDAGGASARIFLAPALNIVKMAGISDGSLFEQNVRLSLGNTKVNRSLRESVRSKAEHLNFPLYHNGINVLCAEIVSEDDDKIEIKDYVVVNGAQSLTSLLAEKSKLSDDLKILVKLIEVKGDIALSQKITRNSNNQNAIKARDLKSNHNIQQRLKAEVEKMANGTLAYEIKQGEDNKGKIVIQNEQAGLVLLAIDLKEPWSCHQKYKVMDDLHSDIFGRPNVTGARVYALWECFHSLGPALGEINNDAFARYTLTRYFLAYLVASIIRSDPIGSQVMDNLDKVIANGKIDLFVKAFAELSVAAANDLNAEVAADDDEVFDHKTHLKSRKWCEAIEARILAQFKKDVARKKAEPIAAQFESMLVKPKPNKAAN
ncbi:MAG: AIPR family protein [Sphingorhabdus sp.]|nr:AIPR family protein [Sphingorhabdus sp.]